MVVNRTVSTVVVNCHSTLFGIGKMPGIVSISACNVNVYLQVSYAVVDSFFSAFARKYSDKQCISGFLSKLIFSAAISGSFHGTASKSVQPWNGLMLLQNAHRLSRAQVEDSIGYILLEPCQNL